MSNERSNRVQIALLAGCLVVGIVIVVALISQRQSNAGRTIVVDRSASTRPAATTRVAATRPFKLEFFEALDQGQREKAVAMLRADPLLARVEHEGHGYATPLHVVGFKWDAEMAKLLLDAGADLEAREVRHDGTPLEWAVFAGNIEMVKWFLERGAKVDDVSLMAALAGTKGRAHLTTQPAVYREIQKLIIPRSERRLATTRAVLRRN